MLLVERIKGSLLCLPCKLDERPQKMCNHSKGPSLYYSSLCLIHNLIPIPITLSQYTNFLYLPLKEWATYLFISTVTIFPNFISPPGTTELNSHINCHLQKYIFFYLLVTLESEIINLLLSGFWGWFPSPMLGTRPTYLFLSVSFYVVVAFYPSWWKG